MVITIPIKNERTCAHQDPSFVYRQDGYELSYEVRGIISCLAVFVKCERPTAEAMGLSFKGFGKKRGRKIKKGSGSRLPPPFLR
jgi:hypothetical protein